MTPSSTESTPGAAGDKRSPAAGAGPGTGPAPATGQSRGQADNSAQAARANAADGAADGAGAAPAAAEPPAKPDPRRRKLVLFALTVFVVVAALLSGLYYWLVLSNQVDTDDAYVGGNQVTLSSQVSGNVIDIRADDTQSVQVGAQLIQLDPTDAQLALTQAEARLGVAVRQQRERYANVAQYVASVAERRLALRDAEGDLARRLPLAAEHIVSGEDVAHARQAVANAQAALDVALKQTDAARSGVAGIDVASNPNVLAARADVVQAWLAWRRTSLVAPVSGYVANRAVQLGSHVTPGMPLMAIVPLDQLWVDANFKESQLRNIRVGQDATVEADVYGGKVVYHGKVLGLSAGTGSAFALLPAQNATGNWIKVVQRVPVRISLNPDELARHPLRIGLSTTATVDIRNVSGPTLGPSMPARPIYSTQALNQPVHEAEADADAIIQQNLAR